MTKLKKIATSTVVAGLLMGGSAFAGTLNFNLNGTESSTQLKVAEELFEAGNPVIAILGDATSAQNNGIPAYRYAQPSLTYTATLDGSLTVSDGAVKLIFGSAPVVSAGNQVVITDASNDQVIAVQNTITDNTIVLDSDSQYTFTNDKKYNIFIVADSVALGDTVTASAQGAYLSVQDSSAAIDAETVELQLWSTSGTEEMRDSATLDLFAVTPQYFVTCESKLNNLINVENAATAFVSTKHGALNTVDGTAGDVMDVLSDVMRFKVEKYTVDIGLDGNQSRVSIVTDQPLSNFVTVTHNFEAADMSGTGTWASPTMVWLDSGTDDSTPAYYGLDATTHTYTAKFTVDGNTTIPETKFKASFYINSDDAPLYWTYTPAKDYTPNADMGQWVNFAYIAQIAGATNDDSTKTKLFITNRSCKAVSPIVTFIYEGKTVTVTAPSIAVDTQGKVMLDDLIDNNQAAFANAGIPTRARYAVEITIPGNAEDFYVYAQSQNRSNVAATKDLPVYNTSTRTN